MIKKREGDPSALCLCPWLHPDSVLNRGSVGFTARVLPVRPVLPAFTPTLVLNLYVSSDRVDVGQCD